MLYFPQLTTGATSQLPCTKRIYQRTVVNQEAHGGTVRLFDPGACAVEWQVQLSGLALQEWAAIDALFAATEGRLGTFQFLDPFGNLLMWSESPGASTWTKDAGVQLVSGVPDPMGTARAARMTNTGAGQQGLRQNVSVPGWYQYCLSVWARSDAKQRVRLSMTAGTEVSSQWFETGTTWRRLELSMPLETQAPAVAFGAAIEAGAAVDVFGFQAEPQVGASKYKSTTTHSGVFSNAYFLDDELRMTSSAPGEFSCTVRIGAKAS
jgi:hypothetical protein